MTDILQNLGLGFGVALQPVNLAFAFVGAIIGTLIGVLPGIGPLSGIALLIPVIISLNPASALIMLTAVYYGTQYGGSTTSILMNVPGEAASVPTTFDGYQMSLQGRAGPALAIAAVGSFIASTISIVALMLFSPLLARWALAFGPAENFALMVLGLSSVSSITGDDLVKSLLAALFGLMVATIGTDLVTGITRYTLGVPQLLDGIHITIFAVGLFAVSEVLLASKESLESPRLIALQRIWLSLKDFTTSFWSIIRGTVVGFYIGILPAAGATVASFMSYGLERRLAKDPTTFGKGDIRGVAAPESANNAAVVGNMIPMLSLGIPGSSTTAVMMGVLLILNVVPGPLLFQKHPEVVWGLIASMYISNAVLLLLNLPLVGLFVQILKTPERYLYPLILALCVVGVYTDHRSVVDLIATVALGGIGYYMRRHDYPLGPAILGLVLGDRMEQAMRQSLIISSGSPAIFVDRPISAVLLLLAAVSLALPYLISLFKKVRKADAA